MADFRKDIYIVEAGALNHLITEDEKMFITHLKVSGYLNSNDFDVLDTMCSSIVEFDDDDNETIIEEDSPELRILDLGDALLTDNLSLWEFSYYSRLKKIVLPKNLESTGDVNVFENSRFLETVVVPETLKEFGWGTFINCECLKSINFPDSLERFGGFSFCGCSSLKNVRIPVNVSEIECAAFGGCYGIKKFEIDELNPHFSVVDGVIFNKNKTKLVCFPSGYKNKHYSVPEGVKIIGRGSFLNAQIESITFPSTLEIIEGWAFRFCSNLQSLDIPDSVTKIGELAFEFCTSLSQVKLPKQLTTLKRQTFCGGDSLKEIDIPASVKIIEDTALGWSHSLETIHLHDGLEILNDLTRCKTLKNIVIPKTVKKIASGIFRLCTSMQEIKIDIENPYLCSTGNSLYNKEMTTLIATLPKNESTFIVPDGVELIEEFVFEGFDKLEHIFFPESLQRIGHRAFEGCVGLSSLRLPKTLTSIDFRAFDDCDNLKAIEIYAEEPPKITNRSASCWKFIGDARNLVLYVPEKSLEKYKKALGWRDIKEITIIDRLNVPN